MSSGVSEKMAIEEKAAGGCSTPGPRPTWGGEFFRLGDVACVVWDGVPENAPGPVVTFKKVSFQRRRRGSSFA